ncbi:MAG TPA: hypothetical protein VJQ56_03405 [Blastocatellia bacterium]|nr:hypothetical protein [Blastocatellia bacterium]
MTQKKETSRKQSADAFGVSDLIELSQQTTLATFRAGVEMQQANARFAQGLIEIGVAARESNLKAAQGYWNALSQARQVWLNQAAQVTETVLALSPVAFQYPYKTEVEQLGSDLVETAKQVFDTFTQPLKTAAGK